MVDEQKHNVIKLNVSNEISTNPIENKVLLT